MEIPSPLFFGWERVAEINFINYRNKGFCRVEKLEKVLLKPFFFLSFGIRTHVA